ncbi:21686_t:CDS:2, partial [Gigaspora rosea]
TAISTLHFNPKIRRQQELIKNTIKEEEIQLELMEIRDKVSQTNQTVHTVEMEPNTKDLAIKDQPDSDRNNVHTSNNSKQPQPCWAKSNIGQAEQYYTLSV